MVSAGTCPHPAPNPLPHLHHPSLLPLHNCLVHLTGEGKVIISSGSKNAGMAELPENMVWPNPRGVRSFFTSQESREGSEYKLYEPTAHGTLHHIPVCGTSQWGTIAGSTASGEKEQLAVQGRGNKQLDVQHVGEHQLGVLLMYGEPTVVV
jgi:hypothetical protein